MTGKLHRKILKILADKQLSISGITRELKAEGTEEHRLILTGYLRALRDLEILREIEVPPSKIYSLPEKNASEDSPGDIYSLIKAHLTKIELDLRIPVGVYVISQLFERPCFREELRLIGITPIHLKQYLEKPPDKKEIVKESVDARLKEYRASVTRIKIPSLDPAYEVQEANMEVCRFASGVLMEIIKDKIDMEGLVPRIKQTKLRI